MRPTQLCDFSPCLRRRSRIMSHQAIAYPDSKMESPLLEEIICMLQFSSPDWIRLAPVTKPAELCEQIRYEAKYEVQHRR